MNIMKSHERGHTELNWLQSHHSFSFGDYHNPQAMGVGPLRVINDDLIGPGGGFPTHPHREMEIFSYVTAGALAHKDSLGSTSSIGPNRVQLMSAGTGIRHSEFNPSDEESTRLLQIWITPSQPGQAPHYQELDFEDAERINRLRPLATPEGREGTMVIRQDATISTALLEVGQSIELSVKSHRQAWVQVVNGSGSIDAVSIEKGDGIHIESNERVTLTANEPLEIIHFDLTK